MKILLTFFTIGILVMYAEAQTQFTTSLFNSYESYKAKEITTHRFTHAELMKILDNLKSQYGDIMAMEDAGKSAEGRSIKLLTLGKGKTKIFMWSQMHGDEPTATMGLMDALNYIAANQNSAEVKKILSETTLLIIPMLNPDGAERFQRRTSQGIDMNRDALRLQTPEAKILKGIRDKYNPEIGFNLHDQDPRYTVGKTGKVATIALLAPAMNVEKTDNAVRTRAKKIAAELVNIFKPFIDGHISRYDDSFEPRAFGDNIQKWGTSTALIESGGWANDPGKMFIRKLNCVALLSIFHSIATAQYEKANISDYENLQENTRNLYDVIIEKATLTFSDSRMPITADIGIDFEEKKENGVMKRIGRVVDCGDLSVYAAFEKISGEGKSLNASEFELNDIVDINTVRELLKK